MQLTGRARVSCRSPQAFAVCDNCGIWYNHVDLKPEVQWQGNAVKPTGFLVCARCWDVPQPQLSSPVLPNDPRPIRNPRPELNRSDEAFERVGSSDPVSSSVPAGEYADSDLTLPPPPPSIVPGAGVSFSPDFNPDFA